MPNITDQIIDELLHKQVLLVRSAEGLSQSLVSQFEDIQAQIITLLKQKDLSSYTRARTRQLMADIKQLLEQFAEKALNINAQGAARIASLITSGTSVKLNDIVSADIVSPVLTIDKLKALMNDSAVLGGRSLQDFWDQWPDSAANAYSAIIRNGAIYGQSLGDIVDAIDASGAVAASVNQIATMVRTSTINIANASRLSMYQDSTDLVDGIQWVSTLDARTCVQCAALDGLQWDMDYQPVGHSIPFPGPTAHANCRCTQVPVLKSWADLSPGTQDTLGDMPDSTRASMDGQVGATINYDEWLASKSVAFQKEVLGDVRYQLWSSGQLSLADMLSQQGNPLSIVDLRNKLS